MKLSTSKIHSLPAQVLATQVALVVLTASAIGLPAILMLRGQLEQHTRQMLDQSSRTAQALQAKQQSDLENLAILFAQRPTLHQLTAEGDAQALDDYLLPLKTGSGLDLLILCGGDNRPFTTVQEGVDPAACNPDVAPGIWLSSAGDRPEGWLLADRALPAEASRRLVVGRRLDADYTRDLQQGTGLEMALFYQEHFLAASFSGEQESRQAADALSTVGDPDPLSGPGYTSLTVQGDPYYSLARPVPDTGLTMVLFFPARETLRAQQDLTLWFGAGIFLVALLGSGLGVWRARQVTKPLRQLRRAAEGLRQGDLNTPIVLNTRVREVSQVAQTLEAARSALRHSLGQLSQEKAWVEHLLESVVEGILTIDRRGRITYFSEGAEQISGRSAGQVLGHSLDEVFTVSEGNTRFSQLIPAPGGRQKIIIQRADERQATLSVTGARLAPPEAGKASAVLVLRDVTDEEILRRLLGEFLANISHEFRTPLSALAASIELLIDQLPNLTPTELRELIDSVYLGVLSLQTLIDNLLEGASIETGRFRVYPKPANLGELLDQAVTTMTPLAKKYGQTIRVELPESLPGVQADPRRTGQVLVNLISNAVKWSPEGGEITLTAAREEQHIRICVADQGPGVPADHAGDIFLRFDRTQQRQGAARSGVAMSEAAMSEAARRAEGGTGLGLSVVKAIVEAQGGQVGVHNRAAPGTADGASPETTQGPMPGVEHGAVFWFTLPALEETETLEEVES